MILLHARFLSQGDYAYTNRPTSVLDHIDGSIHIEMLWNHYFYNYSCKFSELVKTCNSTYLAFPDYLISGSYHMKLYLILLALVSHHPLAWIIFELCITKLSPFSITFQE